MPDPGIIGSLVSIVVPCYNYAQYLPETLDSIINQSYKCWECIIVNDGSTDETESVSKDYCLRDERFRYLFQRNKGLAAARNTGIRNSKGQFLQFLDADDLIESNKLEFQVKHMADHPKADVTYSGAKTFIDQPTKRVFTDVTGQCPQVSGKGEEIGRFFLSKYIMVNSVMMRREVLKEVGLFNESLKAAEDWELWLRAIDRGKAFYFASKDNTDALVRRSHKSMTSDGWRQTYYLVKMRKIFDNHCINHELKKLNRNILSRQQEHLVHLALERYKENKRNGIIALFKSAKMTFKIRHLIYALISPMANYQVFERLTSLSLHKKRSS